MKRFLSISIILAAVFFPSQVLLAEKSTPIPKVGISTVVQGDNLTNPGLTPASDPLTSAVQSQALVWTPVPRNAVNTVSAQDEPKVAKKQKAVKKEEKDKKKALEDQEKAIRTAMDDAVNAQVRIMREERQKEMPYLDRMYIRTTITPLKMQQKEVFLQSGPKNLGELIRRAKGVHSQAKAAQEGINLYHRRVLYALRKLFPEISLNFNDRKGLLSGDQFTGRDWHISLRQPLFNGGILWNTFLQEKSSLEASKKQYDKVISDLIYDLSRAFFEYQRTQQTVEEHAVAIEKMKRFYEMSQEKYNQKLIAEIEYLNVQSLYSQMQFNFETAKQEFEIAKLDLQKYLDLSVDDEVSLQKTYDLSGFLERNPETDVIVSSKVQDLEDTARFLGDEKAPALPQLLDMSYGNRPELKVEAAKLQSTRLGERIRWGEFLPKVFLTYEAGQLGEAYVRGDEIYGPGYKDDPDLKNEWRLMLELNWNVGGNKMTYTYDRDHKARSISQYQGADYGNASGTQTTKNGFTLGILDGLDAYVNVKQAEVDKLNQVVELEKAEKQVLQDVKQAFYDYQKSLIQVRSTAKRAKWRERLRALAEHRLGRKEVEISEYMQAESDLVQEKGDLHKALKEYYSAKAALNHAIGIQDYLGTATNYGSK